ncbi:MAG: hypothetical protein ACOYEC_03325 [Christensenellales bacterium]|jgi:hypothetical protein
MKQATKIGIKFLIVFVAALLLSAMAFLCFDHTRERARALDGVAFAYARCMNFEGQEVDYNPQARVYARNIKVYFEVFSPYYIIEVFTKAGTLIESEQAKAPQDGLGGYEVSLSGELTVRCYAADEDKVKISSVFEDIKVYSDNLPPQEAYINQMQNWTRKEEGYLVEIVLGEDNGNSGIRKADIAIMYEDQTVIRSINTSITNDSFRINDECHIVITVYDNAGNSLLKSYAFNKFDSTPPTAPEIRLVPNVQPDESTKGYVGSYQVTINFGEDLGGSGIKQDSMVYLLNGELFNYDGGFYLNKQMNYTIVAYYSDNAGNISPRAEVEVTNIDKLQPRIHDLFLMVDLKSQTPYKIRINCSDNESGIKSITAQGVNAQFTPKDYNFYEADFAVLDKDSIVITVNDNVGNYNTAHISTYHFGDLDKENIANIYNRKYFELVQEEYNSDNWQLIQNLYDQLSILFMSKDATYLDFENMTSRIDQAIEGMNSFVYRIESPPENMSANINYQIDIACVDGFKKGDKIVLTLDKILLDNAARREYEDIAGRLSGFDTFFIAPFELTFYHNDNRIDYSLDWGAQIELAVMSGYEARYYAVLDLQSNELLDIEVINNLITFNVDGSGSYLLITEGDIIVNEPPQIKGIKFFGKIISYLHFGLALGGAVLFAAAVIVLLYLRYKRPDNRKIK